MNFKVAITECTLRSHRNSSQIPWDPRSTVWGPLIFLTYTYPLHANNMESGFIWLKLW